MKLWQKIKNFFKPKTTVETKPVKGEPVVDKVPERDPYWDKLYEALTEQFGKISSFQLYCIKLILQQCDSQDVTMLEQRANVLSQCWHETGGFKWLKEIGSDVYLRSKPYWPYIGRGFIHITWKENHDKFSKIMGIDLVKHPELAEEPNNAAFIAVRGMRDGLFSKGNRLSKYFNDKINDPFGARAIVNGLDKAQGIAKIHYKFVNALIKAQR